MKKGFKKISRYITLYGFERTFIKVASRSKKTFFKYLIADYFKPKKNACVSLVGCGQFGFSTISFFLLKNRGNRFLDCYDIDPSRTKLTSSFFGYNQVDSFEELLNNDKLQIVYIASNHFSHTKYAIECLKKNLSVYLEKPISVSKEQFIDLCNHIKISKGKIFAGYNRPYSKCISLITPFVKGVMEPITLSCFISGHQIKKDHWYRNKNEGTRICGNVGHWIDLMVHLLNLRGKIPNQFHVSILSANENEPDENTSITITTDFNDVTNLLITSRTEPFEGINESINFQCKNTIAKIDDFKAIKIWNNDSKISKKFFRKDVGHKKAIDQPFLKSTELREWKEIEVSTLIMLEITDMVLSKSNKRSFFINESLPN